MVCFQKRSSFPIQSTRGRDECFGATATHYRRCVGRDRSQGIIGGGTGCLKRVHAHRQLASLYLQSTRPRRFALLARHIRVRNPYPAQQERLQALKTVSFILIPTASTKPGEELRFESSTDTLVRGQGYQFRLISDHVMVHTVGLIQRPIESKESATTAEARATNAAKERAKCERMSRAVDVRRVDQSTFEFTPTDATVKLKLCCSCHGYQSGWINVTESIAAPHPDTTNPSMWESFISAIHGRRPAQADRIEARLLREKETHFREISYRCDVASGLGELFSIGAELVRIASQMAHQEQQERKLNRTLKELMVLIMMDDDEPEEETEDESHDAVIVGGPTVKASDSSPLWQSMSAPVPMQIWKKLMELIEIPKCSVDDYQAKRTMQMLNQYREQFLHLWTRERKRIHKFFLVVLPAIKFLHWKCVSPRSRCASKNPFRKRKRRGTLDFRGFECSIKTIATLAPFPFFMTSIKSAGCL